MKIQAHQKGIIGFFLLSESVLLSEAGIYFPLMDRPVVIIVERTAQWLFIIISVDYSLS